MKPGQTVYVINRTFVLSGVVGERCSTNGFYTRWTDGYFVNTGEFENPYSDENIFCTHEEAKKEVFMRLLRWPRLRGTA